LYNITLTPVLRDEIIAAQRNDEGMGHIKRRIQGGDPMIVCFCEDAEGVIWFKDRLVVSKEAALKKKFWMKLILRGTKFTQVAPRCIMT
jgi:hypothetical protein